MCSYPHHESRVGTRYNAIVPEFDEKIAAEAKHIQEEKFEQSPFIFAL